MRPDAPAFLVEHQVVDDAADRELGVLLDRIVLEVLVAAVAVDEVAPVRVARADAAAEPQAHRRALDVERLVVLDHAQRLARRRDRRVAVDLLEEHRQADALEKRARLLDVRDRRRVRARTP